MKYYTLTFENFDDINILDKYDINILCAVLHYGDGLNKHIHVVSDDYLFGYDDYFVYIKRLEDDIDLIKFIKYLINGHCDYKIISGLEFINDLKDREYKPFTLDDLLDEITLNIQLKRVKSHSYYLGKYGRIYLKNFKDIRYMFDSSSNFYEF